MGTLSTSGHWLIILAYRKATSSSDTGTLHYAHRGNLTKRRVTATRMPQHERWKLRLHPAAWQSQDQADDE